MWNIVISIAKDFWFVLSEMAPYLLLGFFVAGILAVLIRPETIERHLGGKGVLSSLTSTIKATLFGIPLPLCSCGVIPVAASLRRHGANRGATTAFLISTPQTGVDSIAVTYSLMGGVFAVYRPLVALVSGILGGAVVSFGAPDVEEDRAPAPVCTGECCVDVPKHGRFYRIFHYGFVALPQDIGKALLIGLVLAALITALLPDGFFAEYLGTGILPMLVMMIGGIPFYVCATGSVPMALALIAKGLSPGAALVFLMTGPATNVATIATIWKVMGRRTAIIYLLVVALAALGFGLLLDYGFENWFPAYLPAMPQMHEHHAGGLLWFYLKSASAVALLGILGLALMKRGHSHDHDHGHEHEDTGAMEKIILPVRGMTCTHCAQAVERAVRELACVHSVSVNQHDGKVIVMGNKLDKAAIKNTIEALGYSAGDGDNGPLGAEPCAECAVALKKEEKSKMEIILKVKGMTCNHCVQSVERALRETKGVESASVDLAGGEAVARGENIHEEKLRTAVEGLGYTVTEIIRK
ncbi:MAG: SO_0444 family Cu/Zn efflux transporter [Planctomycetota bacterium]